MQFHPLHPLFAARVEGVDLGKPLDGGDVAAIEAAMDRYAVLVFRDQDLSQQAQIEFSARFGPLNRGLRKATAAGTRFDYDDLIDISNLGLDGKVTARNDAKLIGTLANQLWHSDSSFQDAPIKYSMLYGVVVQAGEQGGQTEFCDLRAAYDALPERFKREVDGLRAEHTTFHSRLMLGDDKYTPEQLSTLPAATRPVVHRHPGSGRNVLFVGVHCTRIHGLSVPEGRLLLAELREHATQREFVYRHDWRAGDLVMWDNRATLHRGRRYDLGQVRDLRRTTCEERVTQGVAA